MKNYDLSGFNTLFFAGARYDPVAAFKPPSG
jgi:hypothetical protein